MAREAAHSLSTLGLRSSHPGDLEGSRSDSIWSVSELSRVMVCSWLVGVGSWSVGVRCKYFW